jgi:hypothetical protein
VRVDACADLEGHVGTDGRLYVLDTARVMPAEAPYDDDHDDQHDGEEGDGGDASPRHPRHPRLKRAVVRTLRWPAAAKCAHLIYQLRPKVVLQHACALSSDAWSNFGAHDAAELNADVASATRHLVTVLVPAFAESLCDRHPAVGRKNAVGDEKGEPKREDDAVPRLLHEAGINLRYMGRVYQLLHAHRLANIKQQQHQQHQQQQQDQEVASLHGGGDTGGGSGGNGGAAAAAAAAENAAAWQELLLEEMVSRVVKHRVRRRCLAIRNDRALSAEHEFRQAIISEMNKVLSRLPSSRTTLWHPLHGFQRELCEKFGFFQHSEVARSPSRHPVLDCAWFVWTPPHNVLACVYFSPRRCRRACRRTRCSGPSTRGSARGGFSGGS